MSDERARSETTSEVGATRGSDERARSETTTEWNRTAQEQLRDKVATLNDVQHQALYQVCRDNGVPHTLTPSRAFVLCRDLTHEVRKEIQKLLVYWDELKKQETS